MSRLIDAEVLLKDVGRKLFRSGIYEKKNFALGLAQVIDECETVDAKIQEHGYWTKHWWGTRTCSCCGAENVDSDGFTSQKYLYCSECGARNDGEERNGLEEIRSKK